MKNQHLSLGEYQEIISNTTDIRTLINMMLALGYLSPDINLMGMNRLKQLIQNSNDNNFSFNFNPYEDPVDRYILPISNLLRLGLQVNQVVALIRSLQINLNISDRFGQTMATRIVYQITQGERVPIDTLEVALQSGADPNIGDNRTGDTPLIICSKYATSIEAARLLLRYGADRNIRNFRGESAIDAAANRPSILALLNNQNGFGKKRKQNCSTLNKEIKYLSTL